MCVIYCVRDENVPAERPSPEKNYYLYVNYDLHSRPPVVPGTGSSDSFGARIEKEMEEDIRKLVETGESTEARALRIIFSLITDTDRREKDGSEPLMAYVRQVKAVRNVEELSALCRREGFLFGSPYAAFQLERSSLDPNNCVIQVSHADVMPRLQFDDVESQPTEEKDWFDNRRLEEELVLLGWDRDTAGQLTERLARYELDSRTYGAEYDWDGSKTCILSEEDRPKFRERVQRMTESMNRIELADGTMLDGARTFFEAAADLNGLKVVLDMAKKNEGFDYGLFFRTLARKLYRYFPTRDDAIGNYASDFHPAHFVRCNFIFAQVDEFYTACPAVQKGTEMYCAPEDRVSLW